MGRARLGAFVAVGWASLSVGCFDGTPRFDRSDAGTLRDGGTATPVPSNFVPASAAGVMESDSQRVILRVGGPSPAGTTGEGDVRATLGVPAR